MCGIAGGIHSGLDQLQAAAVLQKLRHRGPDDSGIFGQDEIWLGNTRLAIQDLTHRGHQPMQTEDGRHTMVFNGEIYNHLDFRPSLAEKGARFQSSCDTESLLQAYAAWGENCLDILRGDFAFAVYDALGRELFVARDPMGVKPLYYYFDGRLFLFASELKALTGLPGLDYSLQPAVFSNYLVFQYNPTEDTPFRCIKKLMPGHCMRVTVDSNPAISLRRYHSLPFSGNPGKGSMADWTGRLEKELSEVVERQLQSDAPLGLTLSGGLDSSLIAAMARKSRPDQQLHAFCVNTYGSMKKEGFEDDYDYAQLAANHLGIRLHEVPGHLDIVDELDGLILQLDEPQADPAALHMLHIAAAAHELGIKVLLTGTGGDDVFSGYRRHLAIPLLRLMPYAGKAAHGLSTLLSKSFPQSAALRRALKLSQGAGLGFDDAMIHTHCWMEPGKVSRLFTGEVQRDISSSRPYEIFRNLLEEIPQERNALNKMLFLEQRSFLPHHNLAYMDKLSMAHSVEARVPFADRRLVELAAAMPAHIKLQGRTTKAVLREVAKPYLPQAIINRRKTGFGAPLREWMRHDLRQVVNERLLDNSFLNRNIFSGENIELLIRDNREGRIDGAYTLFSLLSIESWLRQFAPVA